MMPTIIVISAERSGRARAHLQRTLPFADGPCLQVFAPVEHPAAETMEGRTCTGDPVAVEGLLRFAVLSPQSRACLRAAAKNNFPASVIYIHRRATDDVETRRIQAAGCGGR